MTKRLLTLLFCIFVTTSIYSKPQIVSPSWDEINQIVANVCAQIDEKNVDMLLGITAGGIAPTALFSLYLNNKNISIISASSYEDDFKQKELVIWNHPPKEALQGKNVLIVDDIIDSGLTIAAIKRLLLEEYDVKSVSIAVVYVNSDHCKNYPDYWGETTTHWIEFPWEVELAPQKS